MHVWRKTKIQNYKDLQKEIIEQLHLFDPQMIIVLKAGLEVNKFKVNYLEDIKALI